MQNCILVQTQHACQFGETAWKQESNDIVFGAICVSYLFQHNTYLLVFYSQCKSHVNNSLRDFRVLPFQQVHE